MDQILSMTFQDQWGLEYTIRVGETWERIQPWITAEYEVLSIERDGIRYLIHTNRAQLGIPATAVTAVNGVELVAA